MPHPASADLDALLAALAAKLADGRGFDEPLAHSAVIDDEGLVLRVLDLPTLIEVKAAANRAKDRLVLPLLLALLAEQQRAAE
ncbi:MAG TPA: hypothetical protein VFS60_11710 [Thermoanaerobaculia bacterium]|nr:hypothetical protein [Thermoanaerobaculia bacterium]